MLAERECWARGPGHAARVTLRAGPCGWGAGHRRTVGWRMPRAGHWEASLLRFALRAAEISHPSLPRELATGLLVRDCECHVQGWARARWV